MKKIFLSLLMFFVLSPAFSKENVTIVYAFGVGDNQTNYYRALIKEANSIQTKYNFLFEVRGGAGSTVAAKYVLNNANHILGTSSAHFVRPNFYPEESHRVEDYRELLPLCNLPIAISSVKYKNWNEVPKDKPLTIGVAGLGSSTHLTVMEMKKRFPNLQPIPFKGVSEAMTNLIGGSIDFNTSFLGDVEQWPQVNVLGVTGSVRINNHPTLSELGFSNDLKDMDTPQHLIVPVSLNPTKFNEWRDILYRASKSKSVKSVYARDFCKPLDVSTDNLTAWYHKQNAHWTKISGGVKLDLK